MKFFKWLGKSRENEVPQVFGASIKVTLIRQPEDFNLKPSTTTFYPPIEEREDR
jgi:hypothetical protein